MIEELEKYPVTQTQQGNTLIIKANTFLGKETFKEVAQIVKANGGEYVSAGRDSHFTVPIRQILQPSKLSDSTVAEDVANALESWLKSTTAEFNAMIVDLRKNAK